MHKKIALLGGRVHTPFGIAEALLVEGGRIAEIGSAGSLHRDGAEVFDLKGRTVFPGFSDAHMHLVSWMESQELLNLNPCRSIEDLKAVLSRHILEHPLPEGEWYKGCGLDQTFIGQMPNRRDLDELSLHNPVVLTCACGNVASVNSVAVKMLGITPDTSIEGGFVELDEDGIPSGVLSDAAVRYVYDRIPCLEDSSMLRLLEKYGPLAASLGLTTLNSDDMDMFGYDFRRAIDFYINAKKDGILPFRVRQQFSLPSRELLLDFLSEGWRTGDGTPFFQAGPLKLICGGDSQETCDMVIHKQDELNDLIFMAHSSGMQVAVHAIEEDSLEMCLNAFEAAQATSPKITRHQIMNALANDSQLDRMKKLGIGTIIQLNDQNMTGERRWKTMLKKGIAISAGSDAPAGDLNPLCGIHAAVTGGESDEKLSVAEALSLYTWCSAWHEGNEKRRGEIVAGRDADLVILEEDPFLTPASDLHKIGVAMTICGGRVTYMRDDIGY